MSKVDTLAMPTPGESAHAYKYLRYSHLEHKYVQYNHLEYTYVRCTERISAEHLRAEQITTTGSDAHFVLSVLFFSPYKSEDDTTFHESITSRGVLIPVGRFL